MSVRHHHRRGWRGIFAAPSLIALVTLTGLAFGIFGSGWWDVVSWIGLSIAALTPIALATRSWSVRSRPRG